MQSRLAIYADGRWRDRSSAGRLTVTDPTTERAIADIAEGTAEDVEVAVEAASRATDGWANLGFARRAQYLGAIADHLEQRRQALIDLIVAEVGTPRRLAETMQVDAALQALREVAGLKGEWEHGEPVGTSDVSRVPIGVAGLITPWNYPLYQIALKVAPALAAGCPVVLKPSEVAPLNAFVLADAVHEVGLPAGVFNLVPGTGALVGEAIVRHPGIDMISFTGSVRAGKRVAALAAEGIKKVTLELGGKGASVVLDGSDIAAAVAHCVRSCFSNAGQTCAALSRLIVPRRRLAEVEEMARSIAAAIVIGDPGDPATQLGPVVSDVQRERIRSLVAAGTAEGAKLVLGAADRALPDTGYFVAPVVFSRVTPEMTIAVEEIFGPVLSIMPVGSETEAIAAANATRYGLTAAVWASDVESARRVAAHIRAGSVTLNGGRFNPSAPFGGFKQSGFGRERGRFGVEEYLTLKSYNP